mgnify:CR=1 FL=1
MEILSAQASVYAESPLAIARRPSAVGVVSEASRGQSAAGATGVGVLPSSAPGAKANSAARVSSGMSPATSRDPRWLSLSKPGVPFDRLRARGSSLAELVEAWSPSR